MRDPSALTEILSRHGGAGTVLWAQGGLASVRPLAQLKVLANHREEPYRSPLDKWGAFAATLINKLARPMARYRRTARRIGRAAAQYEPLDEASFENRMQKAAFALRREYDAGARRICPSEIAVLAILAEAVRRVHGFRPHPEQLIGTMALLEGAIAEMATGEGKTLTAAMAATVAAWRGLPVHVITSNDYLAARDCEIGAPLFARCGLSAAPVTVDTPPEARSAAYAHDIVYTTAQNMLADHLRDGLALAGRSLRVRVALIAARAEGEVAQSGVVQRGTHQIIVDEADSVLIDEAITPLIISSKKPDPLLCEAAMQAASLADQLVPGPDLKVDETLRSIELTDAGRSRLLKAAGALGAFWQRADRAEELVRMALYARYLMKQGQHYVIEEGEVVLVDELTGRLARQRTLSLGMQQVLEATLGLEISSPAEVSARQSFQRYFARLPRVGGMTGTAREARGELARSYGLATLGVPTHRPSKRKFLPRRAFARSITKREAIVKDALLLAQEGRAVLIGLRSVESSAALADCFAQLAPDRPVAVLNAVNDALESVIVSKAGESGAITIATNMAGRGTDIKIDETCRALGGLHVIVGDINDYSRIDRQLVGRCARQGDPGSTRIYLSCEDELFIRFLPMPLLALWRRALSLWLGGGVTAWLMLRLAQARAEKLARKQRKAALDAELEIEKATI